MEKGWEHVGHICRAKKVRATHGAECVRVRLWGVGPGNVTATYMRARSRVRLCGAARSGAYACAPPMCDANASEAVQQAAANRLFDCPTCCLGEGLGRRLADTVDSWGCLMREPLRTCLKVLPNARV